MHEYLLDVAVLGSENVGKRTLAKSRFFGNSSNLDYMLTIGMDLSTKTVEIDDTIVKILFRIFNHRKYWWDKTQKYNLGIHVRSSHGAIILYDITSEQSLERIPQWIQIVRDNAGDVPILLVGNKLDLAELREVSREEIELIKENHGITSSMEISVKTGENVDNMFLDIASLTLKSKKVIELNEPDVDEYKKRMIKYVNQAEEGIDLPDDYQNLAELVERLKNAISTSIHRNERKENIVYGYILLIRNCLDLLKEPILLLDKELLQTNINQAYKRVFDILRQDRSIYYNTHVIMGMILGIDQTRQFYSKYNVKKPRSFKPILPENWYLYALYLIFVIVILILLKAL